MDDLKPIIAKNITQLRQSRHMTQIDLAQRLNYSDKAISKWERAESVPDVMVLKNIADLFQVPLDYLVEETHQPSAPEPVPEPQPEPETQPLPPDRAQNHRTITILSVLLVWLVATVVYVMIDVISQNVHGHWLSFAYAVPVSMIVWLVFNSIWFNVRRNYLIISLLMWSALAALVLTLATFHIPAWQLLLMGIPGQVIIVVWSKLCFGAHRTQ